jgi:hypothetical protein
MATEVKFGDWIGRGFDIYKQNLGLLVLSSLVATLVSVVSLGILGGPMMAGMILITLHLVDGKPGKPEVGWVFQGFSYFLQTFLLFLVWGAILFGISMLLNMIICVGSLAAMVINYVMNALLCLAVFLVVDRRMAFWPASMLSMQTVKTSLWPMVGYVIVAGLIGAVGLVACGIGIFFTIPITTVLLTIAYRAFFPAEGQATESATAN